jgi:DNA-directed RNA polymerase specialized sigma24 family protein
VDDDEWDEAGFVARWREAQPQLRRLILRFGVEPDAVEDVLNEVGIRMFVKHEDRGTVRDFVRIADAYARNVSREQKRRDEGNIDAVPYDPEVEAEDERGLIELGSVELRASVQSLSDRERRALALILHGGPYSDAERAIISRARMKLQILFKGFEGLAGSLSARWIRYRGRISSPSPALPALAAVVTAATLGGFYVSDAAPVSVPPLRVMQPVSQRQTASPGIRASAPSTPGQHAPERRPDARPPERRPAPAAVQPVLAASATTRLPQPGRDGAAGVAVDDNDSGRSASATVPIYCDDPPSRSWDRVCRTVPTIPEAG